MAVVEMLTRGEAEQERDALLSRLPTCDRETLRDLLLTGALDEKSTADAERLSTLDYLLDA